MRILILGCKGAGEHLAPSLAGQGHHVTVMDTDAELVEELSALDNVEGLLYRGPMLDILRQAGITSADAFMALTESDTLNTMAAQVAQRIFQTPKVFCSVRDPHRQKVYEALGVNVVSPTMALVDRIASGLNQGPAQGQEE